MRQRFTLFALAIIMCCFGVLSALGGLFLISREAVIVVEREREVQTLLENQVLDGCSSTAREGDGVKPGRRFWKAAVPALSVISNSQ